MASQPKIYPNGFEWKGSGAPMCQAELAEAPSKIRFTFPCCGHSFVRDYGKPNLRDNRPGVWNAEATKFMLRYWEQGQRQGWCPKCLPYCATYTLRGAKISREDRVKRTDAHYAEERRKANEQRRMDNERRRNAVERDLCHRCGADIHEEQQALFSDGTVTCMGCATKGAN